MVGINGDEKILNKEIIIFNGTNPLHEGSTPMT